MSIGSEYLDEFAFDRDFPFGMPSEEWTKRDGTKVKLSDMTELHIRNCMRIVGEDDAWYGWFIEELKRRKFASVPERTCHNTQKDEHGYYHDFVCSECGEVYDESDDMSYRACRIKYCPNCGAEVIE